MSIFDLRQLPDNTDFNADICIVGAGPAGLTVALQFADTTTRVCVVESGGLEHDEFVEGSSEFQNVGLARTAPDLVRRRGLGGTSTIWTGRCGVFDAIDFQRRPWSRFSGWPIQYGDISPFFDRAGQLLGLGPAVYDDRSWEVLRPYPLEPAWDPQMLLPIVWQFSRDRSGGERTERSPAAGVDHLRALHDANAPPAVNFGSAALPILKKSKNIQILLHAHVTAVETTGNTSSARGVTVAALNGKKASVKAPLIVLACGGIDNARLLLASQSVDPRGLGNAHDMVGRFLTDHPLFEVASYDGNGSRLLRRQFGHRWFDRGSDRYVYQRGMRLSPHLQRREGLLNCAVHVLEYGGQLAPISLAGRALRGLKQADRKSLAADALGALARPDALAFGAYERYVLRRPSLQNPLRVGFNCVVEQQLDPESRVMLSQERDALGMSKAKIDWRASDLEFETVKRMTEVVASEMSRLRYAMPAVADWLKEGPSAFRSRVRDFAHPMCSTRMSADPANGVVDANCEVHGVSGLFVSGSSIFGTAGYMNPTLMVVSLSLRLADHLKTSLKGSMDAAPNIRISTPSVERRARVGIVGAGNRIRQIYLPILSALEHEFDVLGFTSRSRDKSQAFADETGFKFFDSPAALVGGKPDFLLVAVSGDAIEATVPALVDFGVPLLLETPFCWNVRSGRKTLKRIARSQLCIGVAEQTPFLPMEQLKRQLIDLGLLGPIVAAKNDFAVYDYHGVAALRAYLGQDRKAVRVNAIQADLPSPLSAPNDSSSSHGPERWMQGSITYDDGALLLHGYSSQYFDSPLRAPRALRVYGAAGSIVDDTLTCQSAGGGVEVQRVRREHSGGKLTALAVETPLGPVRWKNPFETVNLSDEQIAVATLLRGMRLAVHFSGIPLYTAANALQDMECLEAMRRSASRSGAPVSLPLKPLYQAIRTVPNSLIRKGRATAARAVSRRS